jgi:starch-binding outer membrane protein, SusD/RagB family
MKYLLYSIATITLLVWSTACNKDLNVQPQNSVTSNNIQTSSDVEAVLFGGYTALQTPGCFGESFIFCPDLIASDSMVDFVGTFYTYSAVQNKIQVATNGMTGNIWTSGYNVVNIANTVLDKINLVDSNDRPTVQGESYFMRGTAVFYLTGIFAKPFSDGNAGTNLGIPLVLKPTYTYDSSASGPDKPARATVAASYAQIVSDLQTAISLLPTSNDNARADVYSAHAMLSRVYLSMGDYADATTQADTVIESGNFNLTSTYDKTFNQNGNSSEDIFAIQQTLQSNAGTTNNGLGTFYIPYPTGRGDAQIDPMYSDDFEPADFRINFVTSGTSISGFSGVYPNKWGQFYTSIPVIRLAEMYLTRGEGNLVGGTNVGNDPLDDINTVRARSGASSLSTVSQTDFIEERFRELGFEGDRMWSEKRMKWSITGFSYDDDKLVMPIPQTDIDANQNLKQNTGY